MNFLEICREAHDLSGLQGYLASASVVTTGTVDAYLVKAVQKTWVEIQNFRKDFDFNRSSASLTLTTSTETYTPTTILGSANALTEWKIDSFIYNDSRLKYIHYDNWIARETPQAAEPGYFSVRLSDNALLFDPVDQSYPIEVHYYRGLQSLSSNTDTPNLPNQFHKLIVYGAVVEMASYLGEVNLYNRYASLYSQMMGQLLRTEVPSRRVKLRPIV